MKVARCSLKSVSPYSQSRVIMLKKDRDVTHDEFESQTWRERMHVNEKGNMYIPPMQFANAIKAAAKYKSVQIPGKGKSTYTKHFNSVMVVDGLDLGIKKDDVDGEWIHCAADGVSGSAKRVMKCFPVVHQWSGVVEFYVMDDIIDKEVFKTHIEDAGKFIGIGRFRPANRGFYGRFSVESIEWK